MRVRPTRDSHRQIILAQAAAWASSTSPDALVLTVYTQGFVPAATRYTSALAAWRLAHTEHEAAIDALVAADERADDAIRALAVHADLHHGREAVRLLEAAWGHRTRTELCTISRLEQYNVVTRFLSTADADGIGYTPNAERLDAVRTTNAALGAALVALNTADSARKGAREELDASISAFDLAWVGLARFARQQLGTGVGALVPDLAQYTSSGRAGGATTPTSQSAPDVDGADGAQPTPDEDGGSLS